MAPSPSDTGQDRLAIHGGPPARPAPLRPLVALPAAAKREALAVLDDGELSRWYGGPQALRFERAFAAFHGVGHALAVNSGTSALHVAYAAAGLGPGDEVILPVAGYVSVAIAAVQQGAVPVFCDVQPGTLNMDPADLAERITPSTKLIVPVHFWGRPAEMPAIMALAERHGLQVIEDCGQSHGARIAGRRVGSFGRLAAFSFAPRKHISTGQGGMVLARDAAAAEAARRIANKGKGDGWLDYRELGFSYAMPELDALVGLHQIDGLDAQLALRRRLAAIYRNVLADTDLGLPEETPEVEHAYFKMPLRLPARLVADKDAIVAAIGAENVSCRPSHPPMHQIVWVAAELARRRPAHPALARPLPVGEREIPRYIEVECGPNMSEEDARVSARAVRKVFRHFDRAAGAGASAGTGPDERPDAGPAAAL